MQCLYKGNPIQQSFPWYFKADNNSPFLEEKYSDGNGLGLLLWLLLEPDPASLKAKPDTCTQKEGGEWQGEEGLFLSRGDTSM